MSKGRLGIGVITNPNSKKNRRTTDRVDRLQRIVGSGGRVYQTRELAQLQPTIRTLLRTGACYWVSDGGDGSLHWLLNGVADELSPPGPVPAGEERLPLPCLVPTNGGTIDFVAKKAGVRGEADQILEHLTRVHGQRRSYPKRPVQTLLAHGVQEHPDGPRPFRRLGFAAAIWGIGRAFFDHYYRDPLPGPGTILKVVGKGTASALMDLARVRLPGRLRDLQRFQEHFFHPLDAVLEIDGRRVGAGPLTALDVGSFTLELGGLVRLFPYAGPGRLHVQWGDPDFLFALRNFGNLFQGKPLKGRRLRSRAAREISIYPDRPIDPVFDGEIFRGITELHLRVGPTLHVPQVDAIG